MTINLTQFCSDEDWREYLHSPFSFGEYTYASNGCMAVRVARRDDAPEAGDKQIKPSETLVKIFSKAETRSPEKLAIRMPDAPKKIECERCEGSGHADHDCPNCECECEDCDGEGSLTLRQRVRFGSFDLDAKYLRMIWPLPELKISLEKDDGEPVFFTFSGGDGVIMTMTQNLVGDDEVFLVSDLAVNVQEPAETE